MVNPRDYKTTISAIITAAASYVTMFASDFASQPMLVHIARFVTVGGLAAIGLFAKDSQPGDPPTAPKS